jgi:hypothetical protein
MFGLRNLYHQMWPRARMLWRGLPGPIEYALDLSRKPSVRAVQITLPFLQEV